MPDLGIKINPQMDSLMLNHNQLVSQRPTITILLLLQVIINSSPLSTRRLWSSMAWKERTTLLSLLITNSITWTAFQCSSKFTFHYQFLTFFSMQSRVHLLSILPRQLDRERAKHSWRTIWLWTWRRPLRCPRSWRYAIHDVIRWYHMLCHHIGIPL